MAFIHEKTVQPLGGTHFPMSFAVVGHTIPGFLRKYPVRTVNYHDLTSAVIHRPKPVDPVKRFPSMEGENSKGHPLMNKLKQMLQQSGQPQMQPGFERMKEDLSWRSVTNPQIKTV